MRSFPVEGKNKTWCLDAYKYLLCYYMKLAIRGV